MQYIALCSMFFPIFCQKKAILNDRYFYGWNLEFTKIIDSETTRSSLEPFMAKATNTGQIMLKVRNATHIELKKGYK